jgi:iron complex transport system substrate-binding protein
MTNQAPMTNFQRRCARTACPSVIAPLLVIAAWSLAICSPGCDRSASVAPAAKSPTVASLVPGATDLIVGMGAADHLVAVSKWDFDRDPIRQFPRVGDYQTIDWEKLAELKPDVMVVFMAGTRMPPGIQQRADQLGIRLVNVEIERLEDIFETIDQLGELMNGREKAGDLKQKLRSQLDGVARRVQGRPKLPTLVARDEEGFALIAGDTFVDDLLSIAGGANVAKDFKTRYPTIDRERLVELAPQVVVQLMPGASPQVLERARKRWDNVPELPAVKSQQVHILTDWYVLQPGSHVGELAQKLADVLHPPDTAR